MGLGGATAHKLSPRRGARKAATPKQQSRTAQAGSADAAEAQAGPAAAFSFDLSKPAAAGSFNRAFTELDGNRDPLRPGHAAPSKDAAAAAASSLSKPADFSSWASTLNGIAAHADASPSACMKPPGPFAQPQQGPGASRFQPSRQTQQSFMPNNPSANATSAVTGAPCHKIPEAHNGPRQGIQSLAGFCFGKPGPSSPSSKAAGRHAKPSSPSAGPSNKPPSPAAPAPPAAAAAAAASPQAAGAAYASPSFPGFAPINSTTSSIAEAVAGAQATPARSFAAANGGPSFQADSSPAPMSTSTPWQGPARAFGTPISAVPMENTGGPRFWAGTTTAAEEEESEPVKRLFDTPGFAEVSPGDSEFKGSQDSSFSFQIGVGTPITPHLAKGTTPRVRLRGRHSSAAATPAPFAGFAVSSPSPERPPPEPLVFGSGGGNRSKTAAPAARAGDSGLSFSFSHVPQAGTAVPAFPTGAAAPQPATDTAAAAVPVPGTSSTFRAASASPMPSAAAAASPASAGAAAGAGVSPGFSPMAWSPADGVGSSPGATGAEGGAAAARATPFMVFGARGQGLGAEAAPAADALEEQLAAMGLAGPAAARVSQHLSCLFTKLQMGAAEGRATAPTGAAAASAGDVATGAADAAWQQQQQQGQWGPRAAAGVAAAGGAPADLLQQLLAARAALRELHSKGRGAQQQGPAGVTAGGGVAAADGDEGLEELLSEVLLLGKEAGVQQEALADGLVEQLASMKLGKGAAAAGSAGGRAAGAAAGTAAAGVPGTFNTGSTVPATASGSLGWSGGVRFGVGAGVGSRAAGSFSFGLDSSAAATTSAAAAGGGDNGPGSGFTTGRSDASASPLSAKGKLSGRGKTVRVKGIGKGTPVAPRAATATAAAAFPGGLGAPHGAAAFGSAPFCGDGPSGTGGTHPAGASTAAAAGTGASNTPQPNMAAQQQQHIHNHQQQQQPPDSKVEFHPGVASGTGSGGAATPSRRKVFANRSPQQARRQARGSGSSSSSGSGAAAASASAAMPSEAAASPAAHAASSGAQHRIGHSWQGTAMGPAALKHKQSGGAAFPATAAARQDDAKSVAASWRAKATESYKAANYKLAEEQYRRAIEALKQTQGAADELAQLYSNRGGARLMLQRPNAALKDALASIQSSRKYVRGYLRAASCYTKLGNLAGAHQVLSRIADMTSASNPVWRELSQKVAEVEGRQGQLKALRKGVIGVEEVGQLEESGGMGLPGTGALGNKEAEELRQLAGALALAMPYAEEVAALKAWLALRAGDLAAASRAATWSSTVMWDWQEANHQQQHVHGAHAGMGPLQLPLPLGMSWEWWIKAQVSYHQGNLEDAQRLLKEAVLGGKLHVPGSGAAEGSRSSSSGAIGQWARPLGALVPTQTAAEQLLEDLLLLLSKKEAGNAALRRSKADEAVKAYSEALAAQGSAGFGAVLYCNRAAAHHSLKQYTEALADCGRALALKPDYVKAHSRMAQVFVDVRRPALAVEILEGLLKPAAAAGLDAATRQQYQERLAAAKKLARWQKTPNHYKLLGVETAAAEEEIRRAFKKLALRHHPDKAVPSCRYRLAFGPAGACVAAAAATEARLREQANALFNFISTAHEELSDKLKRRKVDQLLDVETDPEDLLSSYYKSSTSSYGRSAGASSYGGSGSGARRSGAGYGAYGSKGTDPFFWGFGGMGNTGASSRGGAAGYKGAAGQAGGSGRSSGSARQGSRTTRPSNAWWGDVGGSDESDSDEFGR